MKFLLGIVSIVAIFAVNGQDFDKEPATGGIAVEADGKDIRFLDGSISNDPSDESLNQHSELDLQDFVEQDHQVKEKKGENQRTLRRPRCKARNACVVMAGFCVTNATLCSGRLVPEGCKGTNCQCCVPGTIEAMFGSLEQKLQSLKVDMNTKLQSLKVNMDNMNNSNSNLNSELQSIKVTMNNSTSNLNSELQSIKINMNNSDSNLNSELQSINVNMNNVDSNLNTKMQSLKHNMSTSFSNMNSKLENQGCPKGTFLFTPSNQCFRVLNDTYRSFVSAQSACIALGLQLAHPNAPVALRSYLVTKYGIGGSYTWVNGRGSGSYITWQDTGKHIYSSNPLWYSSRPGSYTSTSYCLTLATSVGYWKSYPTQPYYNIPCSYSKWTLCEYVRG